MKLVQTSDFVVSIESTRVDKIAAIEYPAGRSFCTNDNTSVPSDVSDSNSRLVDFIEIGEGRLSLDLSLSCSYKKMYALRLLSSARPAQQVRLVSFYPTLRDSKPVTTSPKPDGPAPTSGSANPSVFGPRMVTPDNWDRKVLVWMKKYKSVEDIPEQITYEAFDKTQNRFRIRIANVMMVLTVLGTVFAVWSGKRRADQGENLEQMNLDWHNKVREDYHASLAREAEKKKE